MAVNLASKFESKTSELMKAKAKSTAVINTNFSWEGVNAINVYTLTDATMGDYTKSGTARYGTPSEVDDTKQTWTLSRDRAFSKTIDMGNYQDTMMVRKPGKFLAQTVKNVIVPEKDAYVFSAIVTAGGTARSTDIVAAGATSAANAYTNFLLLNADISDNEAPEEGRVATMTATYYNFLKQGNFVVDSDQAYKDRKSGDLGQVDGCKIVVCPSSRMPANTDLIITHPNVTVSPDKLTDYVTHKNPPGINGWLLEGRIRYDAFVDTNMLNAIGVHKTA